MKSDADSKPAFGMPKCGIRISWSPVSGENVIFSRVADFFISQLNEKHNRTTELNQNAQTGVGCIHVSTGGCDYGQ